MKRVILSLPLLGCISLSATESIKYQQIERYNLVIEKILEFPKEDPNHSNHWKPRAKKNIKYIVLHITVCDYDKAIKIFTSKVNTADSNAFWVSAHYIIKEDGSVVEVVPEKFLARHAGTGDLSFYDGRDNFNEESIGIELVNTTQYNEQIPMSDQEIKWLPLPDMQIEKLVLLLKGVCEQYKIDPRYIIGHSDCAYSRKEGETGKIDPGPLFPWWKIYREGIGMWIEEKEFLSQKDALNINPEQFKDCFMKNIKIIGYKKPKTDLEFKRLVSVFQARFSKNQKPLECNGILDLDTVIWAEALVRKYFQHSAK